MNMVTLSLSHCVINYVTYLYGHAHEKISRELLYEDAPDPSGHFVGRGLSVVQVQRDRCQRNGDCDHHHAEQQVSIQVDEKRNM